MSIKKRILVTVLLVLFVSVLFILANRENKRTIKIKTKQGEPVQGNVYFKGKKLGKLKDGTIKVSGDKLNIGELKIEGTYKLRDYEFKFDISSSQLEKETINFEVDGNKIDSYIFNFSVNETGEPLNGIVYLQNKKLGRTRNGEIVVPMEEISPGNIFLNGTYKNNSFEFTWKFDKNDLNRTYIHYVINKDQKENLVFDARSLNTTKIENYILKFVNRARNDKKLVEQESSITSGAIEIPEFETLEAIEPGEFIIFNTKQYLESNPKLREIAREKSQNMKKENYFSHESKTGESLYDKLKGRKIFYHEAGENIYFTGTLTSGITEKYIALDTVRGWLNSPGHRSLVLDRDRLYSDAGVGVDCRKKYCFVTLDMANMELNSQSFMKEDYCSFTSIYDPSYQFNYNTPVVVSLRATEDLNAYIVEDEGEFDECVDRDPIDSVKEFRSTESFTTNFTASKGYGIVLETNSDTNITMKIDYSS